MIPALHFQIVIPNPKALVLVGIIWSRAPFPHFSPIPDPRIPPSTLPAIPSLPGEGLGAAIPEGSGGSDPTIPGIFSGNCSTQSIEEWAGAIPGKTGDPPSSHPSLQVFLWRGSFPVDRHSRDLAWSRSPSQGTGRERGIPKGSSAGCFPPRFPWIQNIPRALPDPSLAIPMPSEQQIPSRMLREPSYPKIPGLGFGESLWELFSSFSMAWDRIPANPAPAPASLDP